MTPPVFPVQIFNTTPLALNLSVNNGPELAIPAAEAPDYAPQSPAETLSFSFTDSGPQGTLFPGLNVVTLSGSGQGPSSFMLNITDQSEPQSSLQLYLFATTVLVPPILLIDGKQI